MAQKFNIIISINNGKPVSQVFNREDAHKAKDAFTELRSQGKEAYLYLLPTEDKSCKSTEQYAASTATEAPKSVVDSIMSEAKSLVKPKKTKTDDLSI